MILPPRDAEQHLSRSSQGPLLEFIVGIHGSHRSFLVGSPQIFPLLCLLNYELILIVEFIDVSPVLNQKID